jgi:hypothetical protein
VGLLGLIFFFPFWAAAQNTNEIKKLAGGTMRTCTELSPPIHFQSIREGGDTLFVLAWDEPAGWTEALHVRVSDNRGMIAWYRGLSTPMTHVGFVTQQDTVEVAVSRADWSGGTGCQYLPFSVPLVIGPSNVRDTTLTLFPDPDQYYLRYRDAQDLLINVQDPMSAEYPWTPIHQDTWYLNRLDGRIRSGAWWLENRSVRYLADVAEWMILEPNWHYNLPEQTPQRGHWWLQQKRLSRADAATLEFHHSEEP